MSGRMGATYLWAEIMDVLGVQGETIGGLFEMINWHRAPDVISQLPPRSSSVGTAVSSVRAFEGAREPGPYRVDSSSSNRTSSSSLIPASPFRNPILLIDFEFEFLALPGAPTKSGMLDVELLPALRECKGTR